ncbi:MAG TPA: type II CAAX endopeptidase family protein [Blastocatellia bacterium]|nr:type II CAAX endopeptidase family protein [Blastocatellia bacterium]
MKQTDFDPDPASTNDGTERQSVLGKIFVNIRTEQLRGIWKVLLFLSIWFALYAPGWFSKPESSGPRLDQSATYWLELIQLAIFVPVLLGETAISTRLLEHRTFKSIGVAFHKGWARDLSAGWLIGILMIAVVAGIHRVFRQGEFNFAGLNANAALMAILQAAVLYLLAAFFEELMMRGFTLQALIRDYSTTIAVIVMSIIFAAFHNANPDFSWLAFANTFLAGVWLSIAYLKTRSLWLCTGLHTGWNYAMGVIFGYPVSGLTKPTDSIWKAHIWGNHWITGSDYGPEGGFVVTIVIALAAWWLWRTKWFQPSEEMKQLTKEVFEK